MSVGIDSTGLDSKARAIEGIFWEIHISRRAEESDAIPFGDESMTVRVRTKSDGIRFHV
jgi:hypothetical protein